MKVKKKIDIKKFFKQNFRKHDVEYYCDKTMRLAQEFEDKFVDIDKLINEMQQKETEAAGDKTSNETKVVKPTEIMKKGDDGLYHPFSPIIIHSEG